MSNAKHYLSSAGAAALLIVLLCSCGGKRGHLQVDVKLDNIEMADIYIYSDEGVIAQIDTIHLKKGHGEYETPLAGPATFHLVYPGFKELVFWGNSGEAISVKGDAQNLKSVKVEGNKHNEQYTRFRLQTAQMSPDSVKAEAERFIRLNPSSPVSMLLLSQHFTKSENAVKGLEMCNLIEQEKDADLLKLDKIRRAIQSSQILKIGSALPSFKLTTEKGKTITDKQFRGKHLILNFWANWMGNSNSNYNINRLLQNEKNKFKVLSYSLDNDSRLRLSAGQVTDSLAYVEYCDNKVWNSPLVKQFGIHNLPTIILVDPKGKILAVGNNWQRDIEPAVKKIK